MSTAFPLPSSPHCAPSTTVTFDIESLVPTLDIRCFFLGEATAPSPFACCCIFGHADIRGVCCRACSRYEWRWDRCVSVCRCALIYPSAWLRRTGTADLTEISRNDWSEAAAFDDRVSWILPHRAPCRSIVCSLPPPSVSSTAKPLIYQTTCWFPSDRERACATISCAIRENAPVRFLSFGPDLSNKFSDFEESTHRNAVSLCLDVHTNLDNCLDVWCESFVRKNAHNSSVTLDVMRILLFQKSRVLIEYRLSLPLW